MTQEYTNNATCFDKHLVAPKVFRRETGDFPVPTPSRARYDVAIHGSGPFFPADNLVSSANHREISHDIHCVPDWPLENLATGTREIFSMELLHLGGDDANLYLDGSCRQP